MTDIEKLACSMTYEQNIIKLAEETGEMLQAVSKCYAEETPAARQKVTEEIADAMICMDVIRCLLRISDAELVDMRHHKIKRNLQRIGDNPHDMLTINDRGELCYQNLQNGDGCRTGDDSGGYEFVPNEDEYGYNADPRKEADMRGEQDE